jgi:signal transduction histidine kinase
VDVEVPRARLDRDLIRRALANFVENAQKYAPAGTEIVLEAKARAGGGVILGVAAAGPGVPAALRPKIFEPYVRLERDAAQRARTSHGLGLAFCRLSAKTHGGRVWIDDVEPKGAAFRIELPAVLGGPHPTRS